MNAGVAALRSIARSVRALSRVPSQMAKGASADIRRLLFEQFAAQTDAYGAAWAPHAESTIKRWGEHPIGDLTGAMMNIDVSPRAGAGIVVTLGAPWSGFFHGGTRYMPARPILPTRGLPPSWVAALRGQAEKTFRESLS